MKKFFLLILLVGAGLVACGRSTNTNGVYPNGVVNPLATNCLYNGTCGTTNFNNGIFTNYPIQNGYYLGYNNGFQNGFSGCGASAAPAFHSSIGLACLPHQHLQGVGNLAYWNWDPYGSSFSFYGYYSSGFSTMGHGGVFGLCLVGSRSCGIGSCIPIAGGIWGVCGHGHGPGGYRY